MECPIRSAVLLSNHRNTNAYGVEPITKGRAAGSSGSTNDCDLPRTEYSSGYVPDGDRVGDVFRKTQPNE